MTSNGESTKRKSIVLLSGGMDSAYSFIWACINTDVQAALFVQYGQRGYQYELHAAQELVKYARGRFKDQHIDLVRARIQLPNTANSLTNDRGTLDPEAKDWTGNPITFVPGRNMIMIALAANLAYGREAQAIVGGWVAIDVSYPDCRADFLKAADSCVDLALGLDIGTVKIMAPCLYHTKTVVVRKGEEIGVPWRLTRSCYGNNSLPCGECDSCLVRARAFLANDLADPSYLPLAWQQLKGELEHAKESESVDDQ